MNYEYRSTTTKKKYSSIFIVKSNSTIAEMKIAIMSNIPFSTARFPSVARRNAAFHFVLLPRRWSPFGNGFPFAPV